MTEAERRGRTRRPGQARRSSPVGWQVCGSASVKARRDEGELEAKTNEVGVEDAGVTADVAEVDALRWG